MTGKQLTSLGISAICFATTFAIGWKIPADPPSGQAAAPLSASHDDVSKKHRVRREAEETAPQKAMRMIRDAGSPEEKLRNTISLVNTIQASEFADWVEGDLFTFRSGPEMFVFRVLLFDRWIAEDPDSLFAWAAKNNYGQAHRAVLDIANKTPEILMDYHRDNPDKRSELSNLTLIATNHPDMALLRLIELSDTGVIDRFARSTQQSFARIAKTSLATLEASLDLFSPAIRKEAETAISGQRLADSFSEGLGLLSGNPRGREIFELNLRANEELKDELITHLEDLPESWKGTLSDYSYLLMNRGNAKKWLEVDLVGKGFSEEAQSEIRQRALGNIAQTDPQFALQEIDRMGISGWLKDRAITTAIAQVSDDPAKAEAMIFELSSERDREKARAQLEISQLQKEMKNSPDSTDWLGKLGDIEPGNSRTSDLVWGIQEFDPASLEKITEAFGNLLPTQKQNIAAIISSGIGNHETADSRFIGEAIRYYTENPPTESANLTSDSPEFAASSYAVNLVKKDPSRATQWIATLPKGETKLWAQKNVAKNWAQYDPKAVGQWLKTVPATEASEIKKYMGE